jgi:hypothetical protein
MENSGLESKSDSIDHAAKLIDRLLNTSDGGQRIIVGQYEASTIVALLTDSLYRADVMSRVEGL